MLCERCLAMAFTFRKPSTACQITDFNLSGYRGALRGMSDQCSLYPQKQTSELSPAMSAFVPKADIEPVHSITSSARTRTEGGIFNPSALAALLLTINSSL